MMRAIEFWGRVAPVVRKEPRSLFPHEKWRRYDSFTVRVIADVGFRQDVFSGSQQVDLQFFVAVLSRP